MNRLFLLPLALLVGTLGACAPAPASQKQSVLSVQIETPRAGLPEVRITTREFEFAPQTVQVPANQPFTLVLDNSEGVVEHDVDVPALGGLHIHAMPHSEARMTVSLTAAPGTYQFGCTVPGHRAAGMRGVITVTSS